MRPDWLYTKTVKKHFFHPQNFIKGKKPSWQFNGYGAVGSPACGDLMKFWIYVDPKTERIKKIGWQTFGCASAIASTSILSEMVSKNRGMKISKALKITPYDIIKKLGGLPSIKIHCSVLGDQALKKAIKNYLRSKNNSQK